LEFLSEYGLFLAKAITFVVAVMVVVGVVAGLGGRVRKHARGELEITHLNDIMDEMGNVLQSAMLKPSEQKQLKKQQKKALKASKKLPTEKKRIFLLNFKGDMRASAVTNLREEITAVLSQATSDDEVVVRLESAGGMVHSYGLASSQLDRVKKKDIPLTVCVDKVAASGGYMMACVANKILAAPFSILGSIGVVAQLPNFNRLLKKHDVDIELHTAGEHKRTLTMLGENTDEGREKFIEDLEDTHELFKEFVSEHRESVDINTIATGEIWLGTRAKKLALVDDLMTSDEYLVERSSDADIYEVKYIHRKSLPEKVGLVAENSADRLLMRWWNRLCSRQFFS
jgi:serine protease SohB